MYLPFSPRADRRRIQKGSSRVLSPDASRRVIESVKLLQEACETYLGDPPKYSVGTKVRKYFEGHGWFSGEVASYDREHYHVIYEDGDSEDCNDVEMENIVLTSDLANVLQEACETYLGDPPKYSVGTKVKKYFKGHGWFSGEVTSYDREHYHVIYEDGDSEDCDDAEMENIVLTSDLANVEVGSRVAVYWPDDDQYYEATVTRERNKKRPLCLEYDDGDSEWIDLRKHRFRLLSGGTRRRSDDDEVIDDEDTDDESGSEASSSDQDLDGDDLKVESEAELSIVDSELEPSSFYTVEGNKRRRIDQNESGACEGARHDIISESEESELCFERESESVAPDNTENMKKPPKEASVKGINHEKELPDELADASESDLLTSWVGTKVKKFFEGYGWFAGIVTSFDGECYQVTYQDGDQEEYNDREMDEIVLTPDLAKVEIGSRVAVYWPDDDKYYKGTVTRERNKKRPFYLEYDDGDHEWIDFRQHEFRLLQGGYLI